MLSTIVTEAKSVVHVDFHEFEKECMENHMSLQDHEDPDIVKAWYGEEYMGYFNKRINQGFLLLETMAPPIPSMLH